MDDETRRYLTESILGERFSPGLVSKPYNFEDNVYSNRTFDNRDDMMDLYQAIEMAGKWRNFLNWVFNDLEEPDRGDSYYSTASIAWLFCLCKRWVTWDLSGEGYEDRCQMVAEFWGENENGR